MDIVLYPDQESAVEALREGFHMKCMNQLLSAPTGSGKTRLSSYLIQASRAKGRRSQFIVDRSVLVKQTSDEFDLCGIPHGVIQANHWRNRPWERVQVVSAQTLERRPVHMWPETDLLFVDEAHVQRKATAARLAGRKTRAVGLTATPLTKGLGITWDRLVSVATTNALIQLGRLASYQVFAPSQPDMKGVKVRAGEWEKDETSARAMPIIGDCVAEYLKHANGKKFIAFCVDVAHCQEMQKQFLAAGVNCALYTYKTGDDERDRTVAEFRKPDSYIRGLISVGALSRGFDVPDVEVGIFARPLRESLAEFIQELGRILRADPRNPGKVAIALDHAGNFERFWDRLHDFFENGAETLDDGTKKEAKPKERPEKKPAKCPQCKHLHKPAPACPACGFAYATRNGVLHVPGELSLVGGSAATRVDRQALYSQLLHYALAHNCSREWAAHRFRERCGVWPNNLSDTPIPPSPEIAAWALSRRIAFYKARGGQRKGRAA